MGTQNLKKVPMGTRVPKWGPIWEQCLIFAPGCLVCQCIVGFFQLHEEFVIASRFVRVVDQRQLLVLRLDLLLIRRDTHLVCGYHMDLFQRKFTSNIS